MKGVIFDLDGVLIDSRENMSYAWSMVKHHCKIDISFEKYFEEIGKPFKDILHAIGVPEVNYEQVEKIYNSYANDSCNKIIIYDGVKDTLSLLKKNYLLAIVTSKPKERTDLILNRLPFFDFVCCPSESLYGKPSPDQMLYTLKKLRLNPDEVIYVGDMKTDYDCAHAAGVKFVHAKYGYGDVKCKYKIDRLSDIPKLLV
tara:strand:+ start:125 stop:724 length:600 start_codon:yes stop_codon:yes gene_type:complete